MKIISLVSANLFWNRNSLKIVIAREVPLGQKIKKLVRLILKNQEEK